ncbi:hypothetical protein VKT23_014461 [Stygiomarasmius scandens]|uniref:Heterokaryon incompatibility domain-containing protein n=1 Tax=Marasmiellus scandens TaxID=2682957 RepID=A0ABR1J0A3_9AGAR
MRLLNTKTYKVVEFYTDIPLYAILSHTWEKKEVTFQDIQNLRIAKRKAGWSKVQNACRHACEYTFDWIWIDSCCIDKSSSAELSEALNSMYQYYTDAEVCYVYLSDVSSKENPRDPRSRFRSSKWFTRGWTLQELLAPMYAVFLDADWKEIGTRWSLRDAISAITTIPIEIFEGQKHIDDFSIAQKMSWAASRETTRPEDESYCLMGIFNVNMPPIYGEGSAKAFMRLQQEIIKISDDRSIFAWVSRQGGMSGLLASSPKEFRTSGQVTMSDAGLSGDKSSFSFGNNGLRIYLPLVPVENQGYGNPIFLASIHCKRKDIPGDNDLSIYLEKTGEQQYVRCRPREVVMANPRAKELKEIIVKEYSPRRRIRREDGAIDYDSIMKKSHFKLSPSAQCLFVLAEQEHHLRGEGTSAFLSTISARLRYSGQGEEEEFSCTFTASIYTRVENVALAVIKKHHNGNEVLCVYEGSDSSPEDRVQWRLESGLLHIRLHIGGGQRRAEIDHELVEDCPGFRQLMRLQPPSWNCLALLSCLGLYSENFSFESVFPLNFFDREEPNEFQIYMACNADTPRLLTYRLDDKRFHVAVGFHESGEAWTDIFLSQQEDDKTNVSDYQDAWEHYLDSGVWKARQASASLELEANDDNLSGNCQLTATVRYNQDTTALRFDSHLLFLHIKKL